MLSGCKTFHSDLTDLVRTDHAWAEQRVARTLVQWGTLVVLIVLALFGATQAKALMSVETTIVRCELADHSSLFSYGPGGDDPSVKRRFSTWMMGANAKLERMPMVIYWTPKVDGGPIMRVQTNSQDRKSAHLLSVDNDHVSAVLSLSDISITRSLLVTVNFRRETVAAARIESGTGGVRTDAFTLNCEFEPSATIVPGLLGDRFKFLDDPPKTDN